MLLYFGWELKIDLLTKIKCWNGDTQGTLNMCSAEIVLRVEITSILIVDLLKDYGGNEKVCGVLLKRIGKELQIGD